MRRRIDTQALLARVPLFEGLGHEGLARLGGAAVRRELTRGSVLLREGDVPGALYAVVFGRVELSTTTSGARRVVGRTDAGHSFGEAMMFLERPSLVTATASSDSLVLEVPKWAIDAELARNPALVHRVIGKLSARIESLVRELHSYRARTGTDRFVRWLLRRPGIARTGAAAIRLPAAKAAIASQLNLSPEQLSRILRDLAGRELLSVHGRELHVADVGRLAAVLPGAAGSGEP